jgi:phospholipid/cholesterol/gamma-HCH transport system substrate-binding protein
VNPRRIFGALLALCLVLSGCGFQGLYQTSLPGGADLGNNPYTVKIEFRDVLDLVPQSAVKVNDVPVGKVDKIALTTDKGVWVAKVEVSVRGSVQLPANSRADIMQTSLLGEKYVALSPPAQNASSASLRAHPFISLSRTSSAYEAEQVLGALSLLLNEGGLRQIRAIAVELNKALDTPQRQQAARDLISQLTTFTGTLNRGRDDITTALVSLDKLAASLNKNKKVITDALDSYPAALKVLKDDRTKLVGLLTSLSKFGVVATHVINASQTQLVSSLKALDPVVSRLTGVGDALPGALRIAGTFPFPLGLSRQFVRGDYANLDAVLNLNLTDQLCGLLNICVNGATNPLKGVLPSSAGAKKTDSASSRSATRTGTAAGAAAKSSTGTKTNSAGATQLPALPGAGR